MNFLVRAVLVPVLMALATGGAFSADRYRIEDFKTADFDQLMDISIRSKDVGTRARIRSYLARQSPNSAAGLAARQWIVGYEANWDEKSESERAQLLRKCLQVDPSNVLCESTLADLPKQLDGGMVESNLRKERVLRLDPYAFNGSDFLTLWENYRQDPATKARADELLRTYQSQLSDTYLPLYVQAMAAWLDDKNYQRSLELLQRAQSMPRVSFIVWKRIAELRTNPALLFNPNGNERPALVAWGILQEAVGSHLPIEEKRQAFSWFCENYKGDEAVGTPDGYQVLYRMASALGAERLRSTLDLIVFDSDANSALNHARKFLPPVEQTDLPDELHAWATALLVNEGATNRVMSVIRRSIENAYTKADAALKFKRSVRLLLATGFTSQASELTKYWRQTFPESIVSANVMDDIEPFIADQDVAAAHSLLDRFPQKGVSYRADFERLTRLDAAIESRARFEREHPFIVRWYRTFGDLTEIKVQFATGSARLASSTNPELVRFATLLREPSASPYIFEVSGHTDSKGGAAQNMKLSADRAQAVVNALVGLGVEREKLRSNGYGPTVPRATNQTEAGRQQNRRVEIRMIDNVGQPHLAERAGLPKASVMLPMSGGRWAVMGEAPSHRIDLLNGTSVATYAEGQPRSFVRHERLLLASYKRAGPDGKDQNGLIVYDVKTGEMVARREIAGCGPCAPLAVSPDEDEVAYVEGSSLVILDADSLKTKRVAHVGTMTYRRSKGIAWLRNGRIAVSFADYDRIHVIDAKSMKQEAELTGVQWVHSLEVSGDGRYLVAGDNGGTVYVWDTTNWKKHGQIEVPIGVPSMLLARPDSSQVLVAGNSEVVKILDVASLRVTESYGKEGSKSFLQGLAYTKDGRLLYRRENSQWRTLDLESRQETVISAQTTGSQITWMAGFPSVNRMLLQFSIGDVVHYEVFDLDSLQRSFDLTPYVGSKSFVAVSASRYLNILDKETFHWQVFDVQTLSLLSDKLVADRNLLERLTNDRLPAVGTVVKFSTRNMVVMTRRNEPGSPDKKLNVSVYDSEGRYQRELELDLVTAPTVYKLWATGWESSVSDDGKYLVVQPTWIDGYGMGNTRSKRIYIVDLDKGAIARTLDLIDPPSGFFTANDKLVLRYGTWRSELRLPDGNLVNDTTLGNESSMALEDGRQLVWRWGGNMYIQGTEGLDSFADLHDGLEGISYFKNIKMIAALVRGNIEFRDSGSLNLKLRFRIRAPGEWIAYDETGRFLASPNGADGLYWNIGEDYLPFESLRKRFESRDLVRTVLGNHATQPGSAVQSPTAMPALQSATSNAPASTLTQAAHVTGSAGVHVETSRPNSAAIEPDVFSPPYSISVSNDVPRTTSKSVEPIEVTVARSRRTNEPYQIEVTLNGRVLSGVLAKGLVRKDSSCAKESTASCTDHYVLSADLQSGLNVVQLSLVYRNVRIDPQTVTIQRLGGELAMPAARESQVAKPESLPRLWFFGVGVSKYADKDISLLYPHADAMALAEAFKSQEGKLFSDVKVKTLTNEQASAENVRLELNRFLRAATQQDLVVVFLAGHGVLDESETLYFMTYDANRDEPFSGVDIGVVHDVLGKRPPAQKALVILDICHAGASGAVRTRGSSSSDEAIRLLAQGSGVKVMTASTARELSVEGSEFGGGHGAFSWALIEGLRGAAAEDNLVTVNGLERYVARRVQALTKNHQHPTSSAERFQDYPLALVH